MLSQRHARKQTNVVSSGDGGRQWHSLTWQSIFVVKVDTCRRKRVRLDLHDNYNGLWHSFLAVCQRQWDMKERARVYHVWWRCMCEWLMWVVPIAQLNRQEASRTLGIDCGHAKQPVHCLKRVPLCCSRQLDRWLMVCNMSMWNKDHWCRHVLQHDLDSAGWK